MTPNSKTFCPIPWIFQAVRNNGDLRVCCQANISKNRGLIRDEAGKAYNAKDGNLQDSRNAPLVREMRLDLLNGRWPEECIRCKEEEDAGLNSRRMYESRNWKPDIEDLRRRTDKEGFIDQSQIPVVYYDLRFGNRCNLACRMCGPSDSDSWYDDHVALTESTHYFDTHGKVELEKRGPKWVDKNSSYDWHESEKFWKSLEENQKNIQHIYMAGGEPLLIEKHYDFLESCVDKGISSNILLEYNTNMTLLPERVLRLWKEFREVRVGASIDGFGETFEFQRHPARWGMVYKNLQKLDEQSSPIVSWLAYTVTVYNVMHLPEFMHWKVKESGFKRINSSQMRPIITHHMAHRPNHLNVRVLSDEQKKKVSNHFKKYREVFRQDFSEIQSAKAIGILDGVEKYMNSTSYHSEHYKQCEDFSQKLDKLRRQDSSAFLP